MYLRSRVDGSSPSSTTACQNERKSPSPPSPPADCAAAAAAAAASARALAFFFCFLPSDAGSGGGGAAGGGAGRAVSCSSTAPHTAWSWGCEQEAALSGGTSAGSVRLESSPPPCIGTAGSSEANVACGSSLPSSRPISSACGCHS